ncbi:MAG: glycerol-3-phosphate dehydrogenase/oxidase [Actinobacteria bacterium]|nr:glycerol-3-phosphate dehydrogenase/oxidase [Actinomycetota bacterium]MCA1722529.1 glycerol-3-phosphate dehydrogenase/oxidase [Actinomycetota bacterium]
MSGPYLTGKRRSRELEQLGETGVDVLVIGGGVTGCGVALDAASRGLSVALVEKDDLAFGTSRWSSKLVHGGLRYLASGDIGLALESARERDVLLRRTAPHLVRPLPMLVPLGVDVGRKDGGLIDAGHRTADVLRFLAGTPRSALPRPRRVGVQETIRLLPAVKRDGLRGALLNWDGQLEDDARLVVALARTGASYGAKVLTRVTALSPTLLRDELTGQTLDVRARHVVNATGAWADRLAPETRLRPSKGVHVVLPAAVLGNPTASLTVPVPGEPNRYVFALPHPDGIVHVGLTDDPLPGPLPEVPRADETETRFLLDTLSHGLQRPLSRCDVVGSFAGVRPLLDGVEGRTADLSRRHAVVQGDDGLWTVLGGKLTTYRRMAQDVVDRISENPCRTRDLPLVGATGPVPLDVPTRLVRRYGSEAADVAALGTEAVAPGVPVLTGELVWGVRAEGALSVEDLLERRTRLSLVDAWHEAARAAAEAVMAPAPA